MTVKKHNWITDGDTYGEDTSNPENPYLHGAENMASDYHNGPKCKDCGFEFCHHCDDMWDTECGATESDPGDESKIVFRL
jgi:hypothetical protein